MHLRVGIAADKYSSGSTSVFGNSRATWKRNNSRWHVECQI